MTALTFSPDLIEKIKTGQKTQTRRPVKAGEFSEPYRTLGGGKGKIYRVFTKRPGASKSTLKWIVGCTRAIKPGRTARGVGRVKITGIRRERVVAISEEDAIAEGFASREAFFGRWREMYGEAGLEWECWVLEFEYVGEGA